MMQQVAGLDYGNKLAGTTVLAWEKAGELVFAGPRKKEDADKWLLDFLPGLGITEIFIDAPLSLPGVYTSKAGGEDYFFRECDKAVKAMSPMFLGGLTARAMKLRASLEQMGIICKEAYPAWQARRLDIKPLGYKGKVSEITPVWKKVLEELPFEAETPTSWHHVDGALAWIAAWRYKQGTGEIVGNPEEGVIYL